MDGAKILPTERSIVVLELLISPPHVPSQPVEAASCCPVLRPRPESNAPVDGVNLAGYRRADLEAAVPAGATLPTPTTPNPAEVTDGDG